MDVELRAITRENWIECIHLKPAAHQADFVAPNAVSLAQSKYQPELVPLGIYIAGPADAGQMAGGDQMADTMVGFVMYGRNPDDGNYWIHRFMIGEQFQGKKYGRAGLLAALHLIRNLPGCGDIYLSYDPDNDIAERLYLTTGFEKTGAISHGELVARFPAGREARAG
jgi:diamine N-acetyltransferase